MAFNPNCHLERTPVTVTEAFALDVHGHEVCIFSKYFTDVLFDFSTFISQSLIQ